MNSDLVSIAEAAYRGANDDVQWFAHLVDAVRPTLDRGAGLFGLWIDASNLSSPRIVAGATSGAPADQFDFARATSQRMSTPEMQLRFTQSGSAGTLRRTLGALYHSSGLGADLRALGIRDSVYVLGGDPRGQLCTMFANVPTGARRSTPRPVAVQSLQHVAAHIAAGLRLRRAAQRGDGVVEAVLTPGGRVVDAVGPAAQDTDRREALRQAALASEKARGRLRSRSPEEALFTWKALVEGRWSIVDEFDADGRRHLIAKKNSFAISANSSLSVRERQVGRLLVLGHSNKLIAYEFGVSVDSVATYVARMKQKLGVRTRADLLRRLAPATEPSDALVE